MSETISIALLDAARFLSDVREPRNVVIEFETVNGVRHYFGLSLEGAENLIAQWAADIREMARANVQHGRKAN